MIVATGSPEHVAQLAARGAPTDGAEEADVYRALGLPWSRPRCATAPTSSPRPTTSPISITLDDVTRAFHCHTTYSDGKDSIEAMARAAGELGMRAITITDHSRGRELRRRHRRRRAARPAAEIAALDGRRCAILRGTEADILADGTIDVPPELARRARSS